MKFHDLLKQYMDRIPCTSRELAEISQLSDATLSRYRSGARTPDAESQELENLIQGLVALSKNKSGKGEPLTYEDIKTAFTQALPISGVNKDLYASRLSLLAKVLNISNLQLAQKTGYDPSFISRVLSTERIPADYDSFTRNISDYAAEVCKSVELKDALATLISVSTEVLEDTKQRSNAIYGYLLSRSIPHDGKGGATDNETALKNYLSKLDEFDLNDYSKKIHFDKIKAISTPIKPSGSKHFHGVEGMKQAELSFLRKTVLSSSTDDIWQYSNLPLDELASDPKFSKNWMFGLAMVLKKGIRINIIHDLNRPFSEMMIGLENWIPLYMTGLITPYYLKEEPESDFQHLIRVSGDVCLIGECTNRDLSTAFFYLSSSKEEMDGAIKRQKSLFSKALPLVDIYFEERENEYAVFCKEEAEELKKRTGEKPEDLPDNKNLFTNITITRYGNRTVVISKSNAPEVHFVIKHPRLRDSILALYE